MTRKMVLMFVVLLLALSACTSTPSPTETAPTKEPIVEEPEAYPGVDEETVSAEEPQSEMMVFTDDFGNTFELVEYPQAIISISPSTTEILFFVGAGDQVVGRDEMSLFPEAALEVTNIGALWGELPTENILALEPDLILAAEIISEDQVQTLIDLGLNVYHQANPLDYEGLYDNLRDIAALTGHADEVEPLVAGLDARVKAVQEKIMPLSYAPSVFYELDATDPTNPWTAGSGTFIDYIINMAGGFNAASELQGDYIQISAEELIAVNPNIILLSDAMYGVTPESVAERPGWDVIDAVQDGAIYPIDPNMMSVPGPRLVDALEETARLLHPEVFE